MVTTYRSNEVNLQVVLWGVARAMGSVWGVLCAVAAVLLIVAASRALYACAACVVGGWVVVNMPVILLGVALIGAFAFVTYPRSK